MTRQTTYTCDYSSQVATHEAHFTLRSDDKDVDLGGVGSDSCMPHLCQLVEDWFRTTDEVHQLVIRRIPGTTLPPRGVTAEKSVLCDHPGCTKPAFKSRGSMMAHQRRDHRG